MAAEVTEALGRRKGRLQSGRRRRELRLHDDDSVSAEVLYGRIWDRAALPRGCSWLGVCGMRFSIR